MTKVAPNECCGYNKDRSKLQVHEFVENVLNPETETKHFLKDNSKIKRKIIANSSVCHFLSLESLPKILQTLSEV